MLNLKSKLLQFNTFIDNIYLDKYVELIYNNLNTPKQKCKTQQHHIIPRKFYYFKKLKLDNSENNTVYLLYKNHILAHYYLCLCTEGIYKKVNEEALFFLTNQHLEYIDLLQLDKLQELYEDLCIRKSEFMLGKVLSEETKRKISEATKGKIFSEETRKKISIALSGENNPMKNHIISDEEHKRRCEATKKVSTKRRGVPLSDETKLKLSLALKGKNHPNWGKHLSKQTKKKIGEANTGKTRTEQIKKEISERQKIEAQINPNYGMKNKHHSKETKLKLKDIQSDRIWYTNGKEDIHLKVNDVVPEGFYPGRCKAVSETGIHNKGKVCYNNGKEQVYITEDEIQEYISKGYIKGGLPRKRKEVVELCML